MGNCKGCGVMLKNENIVCPICGFIPSATSDPTRTPSAVTPVQPAPITPVEEAPIAEMKPAPITETEQAPITPTEQAPIMELPQGELTPMAPTPRSPYDQPMSDGFTPLDGDKLEQRPQPQKNYDVNPAMKKELDHLIRRGKECLDVANAYHSSGNKTVARQNFQRAFQYFDEALKIDPADPMAKQLKDSVVRKMV